jgi:hypothetical protein
MSGKLHGHSQEERIKLSTGWEANGVHSALVRINEELLERKVAAPV